MKKLVSLLVALLIVPLIFAITIKASGSGVLVSDPEQDNNGADIYHVLVGGQYAYVHMSLPLYNTSGSYLSSYVTEGDHTTMFMSPGNIYYDKDIWNPNTSLYSIFIIEQKQQQMDVNGNPEFDEANQPIYTFAKVFYSRDAEYNQINIKSQTEGLIVSTKDYSIISNGIETPFFTLSPGSEYKLYWSTSITYTDQTVSQLPSTVGSPYNPGGYGSVTITTSELSEVSVSILYNTDVYELASFVVDDLTPFQNVERAYYWTDGTDKFISMTYEASDPVYLSGIPIEARQWTDTVTWNLTTNEIRLVNKVIVYAYTGQEANNNLYTYLYIPDILFDNIISITAGFVYHYEYWFGGKSASTYESKTLRLGETNDVTLAWENKLLLGYGAYTLSQYSPIWAIGSLLYVDSTLVDTQQIQKIEYPTVSLIEKMQNAWFVEYGRSVSVDTVNNSLYKLNWGQYNKTFTSKVVIEEYPEGDPRNFMFSEIIVVKDGSVLVLDDMDIILRSTLDQTVTPTPDKPDILDLLMEYWWVILIIIVLLTFDKIVNVVDSTSRLVSVIQTKNGKIALLVIIAIVLYFFYYQGIIKL